MTELVHALRGAAQNRESLERETRQNHRQDLVGERLQINFKIMGLAHLGVRSHVGDVKCGELATSTCGKSVQRQPMQMDSHVELHFHLCLWKVLSSLRADDVVVVSSVPN